MGNSNKNRTQFSRKDLLKILMSIQLPGKTETEGYSRYMLFDWNESNYDIFIKNSAYRYKFSLFSNNVDDSIKEPFVLEIKSLYHLLKSINENDDITLFLEKNGRVSVKFSTGNICFENYRRMAEKISDSSFWRPKEYEFFDGNSFDFLKSLSFLQKASVFSVYPEYKKGSISNKNFYGWYGSILSSMGDLNVPDMSIRVSDVPAIRKFISSNGDSFKVQYLLKDFLIDAGGAKMSFPSVYGDRILDVHAKTVKVPTNLFSVRFGEFRDCMSIANGLIGTYDYVTLLYACDNVEIISNTKTGREIKFYLLKNYEAECFNLSISSEFFRKFFSSVSGLVGSDDIVNVGRDDLGRVYFSVGTILVIIGAKV